MANLIGTVRPNGRILFLKEDNAWVFNNIKRSKNPINRIKVVPSQQPIEIISPEKGSETDFPWLEGVREKIKTADAVFLSHKDGALRFGSACHVVDKSRKYFTIGTVQEAEKFAAERWTRVRYFFAHKQDDFRFYLTTMMTHKTEKLIEGGNIELPVRFDTIEGVDHLVPVFDATGSAATVEIVDWRGSVDLGKLGRFSVDEKKVQLLVTKIKQPFTVLEEFREEFKNFAYTFDHAKISQKLDRHVAKKLKALENEAPA